MENGLKEHSAEEQILPIGNSENIATKWQGRTVSVTNRDYGERTKPRDAPMYHRQTKTYRNVVMWSTAEAEEAEKMATRHDDVWVCSFPRSGTTLTQEMTYLIVTGDFEKANTIPLDDRVPFLDLKDDRLPYFRGLNHIKQLQSPRVIKSHFHYFLLPAELRKGKGKIIYTARNPKDAVVSLFDLMRWLRLTDKTLETYLEDFLHDRTIHSPRGRHVREYWEHRADDNVLFLKFEDTVKDMPSTIRKIADLLGKHLTDQQVEKIANHCSIENMKKNKMVNPESYEAAFRPFDNTFGRLINKGATGGWRERLTEDMARRVGAMMERELRGTGLTF